MTVKILETENDNDMRIDIKMVRKYLGDDAADHMKDFCKEHGLI